MSGKPMRLILTQEVTGLGAPGDVVEVKAGYGRNYLVPRQLAMPWTRGSEKQIEMIKRARAAREIRSLDDAKEAASRLAGLRVRLQTRAGSGGRLFGSISTADIAAAVKSAGGPELDRRKIEVKTAIKTIGSHQVAVRLHPEVSARLEIEVAGS
jgi:large subunit ribosomal protein L9